ncbi:ABC transporter ATP-binding protein [Actinomadura graeca]|uniref:ABC transporter ATP-binding protein n=1 Tax=Actinomadura graeca TaxID=2750812 RepID=A0ABX8R049_9ACTN|nr:ABC transporter ATP-binding protein [Actinomadura graeca]QXJ24268.1 ABC transporter ATP-binding protein [Actinomadura graeca]
MTSPLLAAAEIEIVPADAPRSPVVHNASFELARGGSLGICGESGSGKTALVHALLGYSREGLDLTGGTVTIGDTGSPLRLRLGHDDFRKVRGTRIALVPQAASSVLDPIMTIGRQLIEVLHAVSGKDADVHARVREILEEVGFEEPGRVLKRYPHQLSGGQRQRINLCLALLGDPEILVLDEATTDLDAITQRRVIELIRRLKADHGLTLIAVSHDLRVLADLCEDLIVMRRGVVVEQGPTKNVLAAPSHEYTESLVRRFREGPLAGYERADRRTNPDDSTPILDVRGLRAAHRDFSSGRARSVEVLHDISLGLQAGESLGIVGESGSGKSTFARCVLGIHAERTGDLLFGDAPLVTKARKRKVDVRRSLQIVLQNPDSTFNPRLTIAQSIGRRVRKFEGLKGEQAEERVHDLLGEVGLEPGLAGRYSSALSGGQRQRASIARSLVGDPRLLVCDEVVSGLDVESQARVIQLLSRLQDERGLTLVFISHDISVVAALTQRIAVFRYGEIVELGPADQVINNSTSTYTKELVEAAFISE